MQCQGRSMLEKNSASRRMTTADGEVVWSRGREQIQITSCETARSCKRCRYKEGKGNRNPYETHIGFWVWQKRISRKDTDVRLEEAVRETSARKKTWTRLSKEPEASYEALICREKCTLPTNVIDVSDINEHGPTYTCTSCNILRNKSPVIQFKEELWHKWRIYRIVATAKGFSWWCVVHIQDSFSVCAQPMGDDVTL